MKEERGVLLAKNSGRRGWPEEVREVIEEIRQTDEAARLKEEVDEDLRR